MSEKPVVYVIHGDDALEITQQVQAMVAKVVESGMADLNLTQLDGRSANELDLRSAAMALPFLAERRLVVVEQAQARFDKNSKDRWKKFLDELPDSTALVLVFPDEFVKGGKNSGWQGLTKSHWIWKWIEEAGGRCFYRACRPPDARAMSGWIRQRAAAQGGQFTPGAATALADQTGSDTQYAAQEINKLLTYVDGQRMVEVEDVQLLTAPGGQVSVFEMVDALASGNSQRALRLLRALLDESDAFGLFGMVVRQFRLLIQMREALDRGESLETFGREQRLHDFVLNKLNLQAARFSAQRLAQIYHRLLELDEGTKTGLWPVEVALDLFVSETK